MRIDWEVAWFDLFRIYFMQVLGNPKREGSIWRFWQKIRICSISLPQLWLRKESRWNSNKKKIICSAKLFFQHLIVNEELRSFSLLLENVLQVIVMLERRKLLPKWASNSTQNLLWARKYFILTPSSSASFLPVKFSANCSLSLCGSLNSFCAKMPPWCRKISYHPTPIAMF